MPRIIKANGEPFDWLFHCPGCKTDHGINGRWQFDGNTELPTVSPSILVRFGREMGHVCHSFVKLGQIQFLDDCTHALAGRTVDLPEYE